MSSGDFERIVRRWRDVVCALTIVAMVAHNHYNVRTTRDVGADDEAWYVAGGVLFGKPGFPNGPNGWPVPELGSLHCLSYYALSKLFRSPLELYYASWQIRITLIALAMFVLVRRAQSPWWQALVASFAFVNCAIADVWPFPVHTATLIVLLGLIAASFTRTTTTALGVVTITFAFAGFCRPELLYAYGVAIALFFIHLIRETRRVAGHLERRWGLAILWVALVTIPGALLAKGLGNPLGGTRSFFAFAQHYTLELFEAQHNPLNPWANWGPVVARDFPGATTVVGAIRANPAAFLEHLSRNSHKLPYNTLLATLPLLDAPRSIKRAVWGLGLVFTIVQLGRLLRDCSTVRTSPHRMGLLFALVCGFVPFVLSALIVHPRLHYYVLVVVVGMTAVASYPLPKVGPKLSLPRGGRVVLVFATCVVAICLTASKGHAASLVEWVTHRASKRELFGPRQRASTRLRELKLEGRVVALEYAWGTCFYAGYDCEPYLRWDKQVPFAQFVAQKHVDLVIVDDEMLQDIRFVNDPECADFSLIPSDTDSS